MRTIAIAAAAAVSFGLAACSAHSTGLAPSSSPPPVSKSAAASGHHKSAARHLGGRGGAPSHGPVAVHDPGNVTGTLRGPCRARDHGMLPDPSCTPGAIDPAVTQANIASTICAAGYSTSVRPPESQTETFKWDVAEPAYGQHDVSGELDHLVPLELGGANDARNLWVQAGPIPNAKDPVENALQRAVCDGRIGLRAAQRQIASNWIKAAAAVGITVARPTASSPTGRSAWCSAAATYSARYADWDVVVHSNQSDASLTASGGGYSHAWHTNAEGYADVYLRGPWSGRTINVTVGAAHCVATTG